MFKKNSSTLRTHVNRDQLLLDVLRDQLLPNVPMAVVGCNVAVRPHLRERLTLTLMEPGVPTPCEGHPSDRPPSVLARGVHIMECHNSIMNPDCVTPEECSLLDDYLSPRKLRDITGKEHLSDVNFVEMNVDTRETSLGNFGTHLPHLSQLKLSGSIIPSIRDLGSSLHNLSVLWMAQCCLQELDSISSLSSLRELYVAYNEIIDVSPCSMLDTLQVLDLEGNNLMEFTQIEFLALCPALTNLTLEGNPLCLTPSPNETARNYDYKSAVRTALPQLRYLDDEFTLSSEVSTETINKTSSVFDDDWKLLQELIDEGTMVGSMENEIKLTGRGPTSDDFRPSTSSRPSSALRPGTSSSWQPLTSGRSSSLGSSGGRPSTSALGRPSTSESDNVSSVYSEDIESASSDLTRGGVVCGNPSKALKLRHKCLQADNDGASIQLFKQFCNSSQEEPAVRQQDTESSVHNLMNELHDWKTQHQIKSEDVASTKTAQVLRIEHDSTGVSSAESDDDDSSYEEDVECQMSSEQGTGLQVGMAKSSSCEHHSLDVSSGTADGQPNTGPKCRSDAIIVRSAVDDKSSHAVLSPSNTEKAWHTTDSVRLKSKGAAISPPASLTPIIRARRGPLAAVPLLPSKYTK